MPFIKVQKNKAYFKRFQVKYRRRREGKTDYQARTALVKQDKNKYNSPKYRLVVRYSNRDIVCQIIFARIKGDFVMAAAYSHELKSYGMPVSLTSYAAAYATGLLLARRLLTTLKLDKYTGVTEVKGEDYLVEPLSDGPKPFQALLDVGLRRTTTGSKVFAAMKGACDGGLYVPHSETRFVGYDKEQKKLNPEILRKYIFNGHVADYMKTMKEENPAKYDSVFSQYVKNNIKGDQLEALWAKTHKAIRADPIHKKRVPKEGAKPKNYAKKPLNIKERRNRIKQKMAKLAKSKQAAE